MKNFSTNPTDENTINMFSSDAVGRNEEILRFINLLDAIDNSCAIALNGEWGSGKTFFIKQIKLILDYCNNLSGMNEEIRSAVKSALPSPEYECNESYATVYYDAWANDNTEDPILSLIDTIIKNNQSYINSTNKRDIPGIIAAIADVVTGSAVSNLCEKVKGVDFFESLKKEEDVSQLVKNFIDALIKERAKRLVIFIDELDRCKPEYAMRLLERIKHYFDDERIVFVFSLNLSQLQHTVRAYYGSGFDATRYLDKFFDLRLSLSEIDYDAYLNKRFEFLHTDQIYDNICIEVIKYFRFSLRETERFILLTRIAYRKGSQLNHSYYLGNAINFALNYFVPIVIGLSMNDLEVHARFIKGIDSWPLCEIVLNYRQGSSEGLQRLLNRGECFSESERSILSDTIVSVEDRLNNVYAKLFPKELNQIQYIRFGGERIGDMEFSPLVRSEINKIISLLSSISDYQLE